MASRLAFSVKYSNLSINPPPCKIRLYKNCTLSSTGMHHAASRKNTSFSRNCLRNAGRGWSMIVTVKEAEDTVKMCLYIYI